MTNGACRRDRILLSLSVLALAGVLFALGSYALSGCAANTGVGATAAPPSTAASVPAGYDDSGLSTTSSVPTSVPTTVATTLDATGQTQPSTGPSGQLTSTTTTAAQPSVSSPLPPGLRIGVMIPGSLLYQGHLYDGGARVLEAGSSVPTDLSPLGTASAADNTGAPIPDGSYDVYSVKGTEPSQAIAVRFSAASSNGPVWAWLLYEREK